MYSYDKNLVEEKIAEILDTDDISFGFIGDFIKDSQARKIVDVVASNGSQISKYLDSNEAIVELRCKSSDQLCYLKKRLGSIENSLLNCGYTIKNVYETPISYNGGGTVNILFKKEERKS